MTVTMTVRAAFLLILLAGVSSVAGQDRLTDARGLYDSADYEQALDLLAGLDSLEGRHYRALCLIALGRAAEADAEIEAIVGIDPLFMPDAADVSPRVTARFADARRRLLPPAIRTAFADARKRFQAGDLEGARERFDFTLRLLDDPVLGETGDLADLRLVAEGFLDLAEAEAADPEPPEAEPASALAASPAVPEPIVEAALPRRADASTVTPADAATPPRTDATTPARTQVSSGTAAVPPPADDVTTPPETIEQTLPPWRPADTSLLRRTFAGVVRVEIDITGRVTRAEMDRSVHPLYDRTLLAAAMRWRYRPATLNGRPVRTEKIIEVTLQPPPVD